MELLLLIIVIAATCYLAKEKNRSVFGWGIASVFFGFIPLIILAFLERK